MKNFQNRQTFTIGNPVFTLPLRTLLKPWALSFKTDSHSESCITLEVSRRTRKVYIYLANEGYGFALFSTDLGHIFESNVGKQFGVMLRGIGSHKLDFALDIVRKHSLMIYKNLIECNIVGDTKVALLRCFPFISKLETFKLLETTWTTRPLASENSDRRSNILIVFTMTWEPRAMKKYSFYLSVSLVLFWCSGKRRTFIYNLKDVKDGCSNTSRDSILEVLVDNVDGDSVHLHKSLGE